MEKINLLTDIKKVIESFASLNIIIILRNSMINIIPIILSGSFFLLFFSLFDLKIFKDFYILTMGVISIFLSVSIGYNFALLYNKDKIIYSLISLASFFVILNINEIEKSRFILIKDLSADNMFLSIIVSLFSCYFFSYIYNITGNIFKTKEIPEYVKNSLNSIIPFFLTLIVTILIFKHFNLKDILINILKPLDKFGDSLITVILSNLFLHIMNLFGIHGISIINSVLLALWQKYLAINAESFANKSELIYITAYPFFQWFIWIGGAGSTLGLNILLLFNKNEYLRNIGKTGILPSLFNINEPLLFGLPIVFNPFFYIPFILVPIINGVISYFAFYFNLVNKVYIEVPWFFPYFIGAYLSTNDYKAIILSTINLVISMIIYYPFLKAYQQYLENNKNKKI
ncbi:MAG: PTS transporter subunit EIIC [bacterium]|nr:PTS transporter subunit EIIC [bacterium]